MSLTSPLRRGKKLFRAVGDDSLRQDLAPIFIIKLWANDFSAPIVPLREAVSKFENKFRFS